MSIPSYKPKKIFTIDGANACLPLVRAITSDMVELSRDLLDRHARLGQLAASRKAQPGDPYGEEVAQIRDELEKDQERLKEFARELMDLGVEPKGAAEGLVDFPAMIDGRLVFLCWQFDEPEVLFWHDLDAGFAGRHPLTVASCPDDGDRAEG